MHFIAVDQEVLKTWIGTGQEDCEWRDECILSVTRVSVRESNNDVVGGALSERMDQYHFDYHSGLQWLKVTESSISRQQQLSQYISHS